MSTSEELRNVVRVADIMPASQPILFPSDRRVTLTPEVESMLAKNAVVAVGVSGGKDSVAVSLAVHRYLESIGHSGPRVLIHSDLGRIEWKDSLPSCQRIAKHIGWELIVVRRKAGDMIQRWQTRWTNNVARYIDLQCVKLIHPWSTPSMRFCTSELKTAVISSELKKRFRFLPILNVLGIRWQESAARSKMPISSASTGLTRKYAAGITWNAIINWRIDDVFEEISAAGLSLHEAYRVYKSSRVSCSFCIMSSGSDLLASSGCEENLDSYLLLVELEAASGYGFQGGRWLADVAPHLLGPELRKRIEHAKIINSQRDLIERTIPDGLLYEKGWPKFVPSYEEAEFLAGVRRCVSALSGLHSQYLDAGSIIARYKELMSQREAA